MLGIVALGVGPLVAAEANSHKTVPPDHAKRMAAGLKLFEEAVKPILVENCVLCHGGVFTEAGLILVARKGPLQGGKSGPAIVPGKPGESLLVQQITHQAKPGMPKDAPKLADEEIAAIKKWIALGAPYAGPLVAQKKKAKDWTYTTIPNRARQFWSFQPLSVTPPPVLENDDWSVNTLDQFVRAAQQQHDLAPAPRADKRTLIRRATLDLLGLPPTPAEIKAFLANDDPDAYEQLIDRLLADKRFGERWARYWLDVARFAESMGFEGDYDRPFAFHYRDFVIKAFNHDMPYDRFVRWQLAGDEIAPENPQAMMATGFLGAGVFPTQITKNEVERTRYDALGDMANTTSFAFLGLSVGCARCHDHKFDPIPQADYYRFISIFTTTVRSNIYLPIPPDADPPPGTVAAPRPVKTMVCTEGFTPIVHHSQGAPFFEKCYFLTRGNSDKKVRVASAGFPQVLTRHPDGSAHWLEPPPEGWHTSYRRKGLADWIVDTEYGAGDLLARVIVNRLWQRHFGTGIVATPNDFGARGARPTHPELLDWLAAELIANGWHLKPIHRLIMTSATYRQSSDVSAASFEADLQNEWLTRFATRRLQAEAIRDSILAVSGLLDERMFGKGTLSLKSNRRSIYFTIKRSELIPTMTLFDAPEPTVSVGRRQSTTIAPQALFFMNGALIRRAAQAMATRVKRDAPNHSLRRAYWLLYGRPPTPDEQRLGRSFLTRQTASYHADDVSHPRRHALTDVCQALLASSEFLYVP